MHTLVIINSIGPENAIYNDEVPPREGRWGPGYIPGADNPCGLMKEMVACQGTKIVGRRDTSVPRTGCNLNYYDTE